MRAVMIGLVAAVAVVASAQPGSAQTRRWCTEGGIGSFTIPTCAYDTQAQCLASASGNGQSCNENPQYQPTAAPKTKTKTKRKS